MDSGSVAPGQAVRFSATTGRPPIAYTSDSALAAAIRPQSPGSSTIGVKKSVVSTSARSSSSRSTAASSPSAAPTSRSPAQAARPAAGQHAAGPAEHAGPERNHQLIQSRQW